MHSGIINVKTGVPPPSEGFKTGVSLPNENFKTGVSLPNGSDKTKRFLTESLFCLFL